MEEVGEEEGEGEEEKGNPLVKDASCTRVKLTLSKFISWARHCFRCFLYCLASEKKAKSN